MPSAAVPRKISGYAHFSKAHYSQFQQIYGKGKFADVSKAVARAWSTLSCADKNKWDSGKGRHVRHQLAEGETDASVEKMRLRVSAENKKQIAAESKVVVVKVTKTKTASKKSKIVASPQKAKTASKKSKAAASRKKTKTASKKSKAAASRKSKTKTASRKSASKKTKKAVTHKSGPKTQKPRTSRTRRTVAK